jgi:two-component sensor histidine kinase
MDSTPRLSPSIDSSQMRGEIERYDWSAHVLGPVAQWPPSLRITTDLMLSSRFPQALIWGPRLTTLYNDAFIPILGNKPSGLGRSFSDIWAEAWSTIGPIAQRALTGEATFIEDFPVAVNRFGYVEEAYFTFCYSPVRDESGRVQGFLDTVVETTGKVRAERTARLLNAELAHRLQNTLATVQSIADRTLRSTHSTDAARAAIGSRIGALSRAHTLLTQSSWSPTAISAIVENSLSPLRTGSESISIDGPSLKLDAHRSLTLALAINELGTNSVKYGALSTAKGRLAVRWEIDASGAETMFRLHWTESGGPTVEAPTSQGFGTQIIQHVLAADFRGSVTLDYAPEGLRLLLDTALRNINQP